VAFDGAKYEGKSQKGKDCAAGVEQSANDQAHGIGVYGIEYVFLSVSKMVTEKKWPVLERDQATLEPNSEYSHFLTEVGKKVYGPGTVTSFVVRTYQEQRDRSLCGYFAYLSDGSLSTREVVDAYAQRIMIECSFKNFKERDNRPMDSDDQGVDGERDVTFLAVVLESWIRERTKEKNLNGTYTMRSLLDEIAGIECSFSVDKPKERTYSEITYKAGMILHQMESSYRPNVGR
jgi:hypothetical protein